MCNAIPREREPVESSILRCLYDADCAIFLCLEIGLNLALFQGTPEEVPSSFAIQSEGSSIYSPRCEDYFSAILRIFSSVGSFTTLLSVTIAVTSSGGVMSKAGL